MVGGASHGVAPSGATSASMLAVRWRSWSCGLVSPPAPPPPDTTPEAARICFASARRAAICSWNATGAVGAGAGALVPPADSRPSGATGPSRPNPHDDDATRRRPSLAADPALCELCVLWPDPRRLADRTPSPPSPPRADSVPEVACSRRRGRPPPYAPLPGGRALEGRESSVDPVSDRDRAASDHAMVADGRRACGGGSWADDGCGRGRSGGRPRLPTVPPAPAAAATAVAAAAARLVAHPCPPAPIPPPPPPLPVRLW